tara:strand:- start:29984 stop:30682 length:699 start_codon:yes stop_codon:yes gene_type:complete
MIFQNIPISRLKDTNTSEYSKAIGQFQIRNLEEPGMILYTTNPYIGTETHKRAREKGEYAPMVGQLTLFDIHKEISKKVSTVSNSIYGYGAPGVIVALENGGNAIYGLESKYPSSKIFGGPHKLDFGNIKNPNNLMDILGHSVEPDNIVNGCVIYIHTSKKEGNRYTWGITVTPDHDLRKSFPEFDNHLVFNLEKSLDNFIDQIQLSEPLSREVHKTSNIRGSPVSHKFYNI